MLRVPFALGLVALLSASPVSAEIARIKQSSGAASIERGARTAEGSAGAAYCSPATGW